MKNSRICSDWAKRLSMTSSGITVCDRVLDSNIWVFSTRNLFQRDDKLNRKSTDQHVLDLFVAQRLE